MPELVDWHTHCFLHEHRTDEDRALWSQRGVLGPGEATPEQHTGIIQEAGVAKFVDLVTGIAVRDETDDATGMTQKIVSDWRSAPKGSDLKPEVILVGEDGGAA